MAMSFLAVHQAAQDLLDCVCDALARVPVDVPGLDGCPCRTFVAPGTPAADGCDGDCSTVPAGQYPGQLTVHVVRTYPTSYDRFPRFEPSSPDSVLSGKKCTPPPVTAVDLLITLYRCVPGMSATGCPPTGEALAESAMQLHVDMLAIQQAVLCCYAGTDTTRRGGRRFSMGQSATLGPQGDCVGIQQAVTVALDDCVPCPPVAP